MVVPFPGGGLIVTTQHDQAVCASGQAKAATDRADHTQQITRQNTQTHTTQIQNTSSWSTVMGRLHIYVYA
jgi:hypothetical protein